MSKDYPCIHYYDDGKCKYFSDDKVTSYCVKGPCEEQVASRGDEIRSMSDEELAKMLTRSDEGFNCWVCPRSAADDCRDCEEQCLKWLKRPAKAEAQA